MSISAFFAGSFARNNITYVLVSYSFASHHWHQYTYNLHYTKPLFFLILLCATSYVAATLDCKTVGFFSKSVRKSVKRGVRVLHARSARALHAPRACEVFPSLTLRIQPRSRPFVWLLALTWIRKNTDCFAVYNNTSMHIYLKFFLVLHHHFGGPGSVACILARIFLLWSYFFLRFIYN